MVFYNIRNSFYNIRKWISNIRKSISNIRKVNLATNTHSYLIERNDDYIDNVVKGKCVKKFDLVTGFWQIPLSERAKEISAFVTPDGLYSCTVMPFGMKNAPSTFQRLMNHIVHGLQSCHSGICTDDAAISSDTWEEHLVDIREFLKRLAATKICKLNQEWFLFTGMS